jgi:hypothetical protein
MRTAQIANIVGARPTVLGRWIARCPAHDDRSPSLSIAEGHDGRTLIRCWAGCTLEGVLNAVRLSLNDLFDRSACRNDLPRNEPCKPQTVREALVSEAQRYRERRGVEGPLLTNEINAIRSTVARRFGVELEPVPRPLSEGGYGGRERDPAWASVFEYALFVASVELLGGPLSFDADLRPPRRILIRAEEIAAEAMRDLERTSSRNVEVAA